MRPVLQDQGVPEAANLRGEPRLHRQGFLQRLPQVLPQPVRAQATRPRARLQRRRRDTRVRRGRQVGQDMGARLRRHPPHAVRTRRLGDRPPLRGTDAALLHELEGRHGAVLGRRQVRADTAAAGPRERGVRACRVEGRVVRAQRRDGPSGPCVGTDEGHGLPRRGEGTGARGNVRQGRRPGREHGRRAQEGRSGRRRGRRGRRRRGPAPERGGRSEKRPERLVGRPDHGRDRDGRQGVEGDRVVPAPRRGEGGRQ